MEKLEPETRQLAETFQHLVLERGCGAFKQLSCVFRRMDIDYSKKICLEELEQGAESFGFCLSRPDMAKLFTALDKDRNGVIDFKEFMDLLTPPMKAARVELVNDAFNKLDINGDNEVGLEELRVTYAANARSHPKCRSGEWTEEDTLRRFLQTLDSPGSPDGKVTRQEFMNYYAGVSATVDDDCFFDMMMRSVYDLPPKKFH